MTFNLRRILVSALICQAVFVYLLTEGSPLLRNDNPGIYGKDDPLDVVEYYRGPRRGGIMGAIEDDMKLQELAPVDLPAKRDMSFVSRGWGAGGMPFNVLYMNPKSPKSQQQQQQQQQLIAAEPLRWQQPQGSVYGGEESPSPFESPSSGALAPDFIPTGRNSPSSLSSLRRPKDRKTLSGVGSQQSLLQSSRRHYSIIPQLFVSYGWGPIGRK